MAGLLAGVALLSGCSEKQEASQSLPSASTSPTEAELEPLGPEDLPMPDEARTQDAAGAEAFVRYYIELINRTSDVMDAEPLRDFSNGCADCNRIADATERAAGLGHDYQGGEMTILQVGEPLIVDGTAEMALRVDQAEFAVIDASGTEVEGSSEAFSNISGGATLEWDPSRDTWVMAGLTFG
jgi:hypothetical protein